MTESDQHRNTGLGVATTLDNSYELMCEAVGYLIERDRSERHWRVVKRTALAGLVLFSAGMCIALNMSMLGWSSGPTQSALGVVLIQGEIGAAGAANADTVAPAIERACESSFTKAVVLRINSPGGSPADAERIADAIDTCRQGKTVKPVIAQIEGIGASAAYLIAIHADEVYSTRYALVGSIGAVMRSIDAGQALTKVGLKERVYASGTLKAGNSPWSSNTTKQDELSQSLVDGIAQLFIAEVKERRGSKLNPTDDMFSGRVWVGPDAKRLGLIDGNQTFQKLRVTRFKHLSVHEFRPAQTLKDKLGLSAIARDLGIGLSQGLANPKWE